MEILSAQFLSALLAIIIIDLVLAGDNAIVIALAARKLPTALQMRAILWGTVGAIVVRILATLLVVWLLKIPALMAIGGVLLIWIAYKLLGAAPEEENGEALGKTQITGFWSAIRTIVYADAIMGLDNVLGVAGAAKGSFLLVVLGLLISIPIMVWGSTLILKLVDRFPVIIYIGAGVLAWTAASMLLHDPLLKERLVDPAWLPWLVYAAIIGGVLLAGWLQNRKVERGGQVLRDRVTTPPNRTAADETDGAGESKSTTAGVKETI